MSLLVNDVSYVYSAGTGYEVRALDGVSLKIEDGEFIGLIGHTGSGKSTLIQHLNGLLKATEGSIYYNGQDIYEKGFDMKNLRSKVGMVFQYPEHQLFEETIFADVCFGPKNQGLSDEEAADKAYKALKAVGFSEDLVDQSPFDLSGGQKRRAAIAGVLAMEPDVLILDEPTAGLDPKGRDEIFDMLSTMHEQYGNTVILVSHSMEDVAQYVDRIVVMDGGHVKYDGDPATVFSYYKELEEIGLGAPQVTYLMNDLGYPADRTATTINDAKESILAMYGLNR